MNIKPMNMDAFASGQVESKLWMAEQLEDLLKDDLPHSMWLLGGWYGFLPFMLLTRGQLAIKEVVNFDIDLKVHDMFNSVLDNWQWKGLSLMCHNLDVNEIDFNNSEAYGNGKPTIIINSSVEHMQHNHWWEKTPKGSLLALQSCNMKHEQHINLHNSLTEFSNQYRFEETLFEGELYFDYKNNHSFTRYMKIGRK